MLWQVNATKVAEGLGLTLEGYLNTVSGSTTSAATEEKVAELLGGKRVLKSQLPYDVIVKDRDNKYIEVRNICKTKYVYFSPSTATGKGRFFSEQDHNKKLEACDSYVFCDLRERFAVPPRFYEVSVSKVRELQEKGIINQGKMARNLFFEIFPYEQYALKLNKKPKS